MTDNKKSSPAAWALLIIIGSLSLYILMFFVILIDQEFLETYYLDPILELAGIDWDHVVIFYWPILRLLGWR